MYQEQKSKIRSENIVLYEDEVTQSSLIIPEDSDIYSEPSYNTTSNAYIASFIILLLTGIFVIIISKKREKKKKEPINFTKYVLI